MALSGLTPLKLEIFLKQSENRVSKWLARSLGRMWMAVLALALAFLIFNYDDFFALIEGSRGNGGLHVLLRLQWDLPIFLLGSVMALFFPSKVRWILVATNIVAWLVSSFYSFQDEVSLKLLIFIMVVYPLGYAMAQASLSKFLRSRTSLILISILYLLALAWLSVLLMQEKPHAFFTFWQTKAQYLVLQIFLIRFLFKDQNGAGDMIAAPTFASRALILPESSAISPTQIERHEIWWRGILNLLVGFAAAFICIFLNIEIIGIERPFIQYPAHYLLAVLGIISFLNTLSGILRLFGFRVLDATNFVWLSRSPAEYWRRGSVYSYLLILKYIYVPLLSRLKSPRLCRLIAFFVFLNMKIGILNYLFAIFHLLDHNILPKDHSMTREYASLIHWVYWFISLEFSYLIFRRTRLDEKAFRAWASVIGTHVFMSSLYYFAFVTYHYLNQLGRG